ncbi:hypothetical protein [Rhodanobacter umsongensis]
MNERNARDEHNTQYSVPPVFNEEFGWNSQRNEIRNPSTGPVERKSSKTPTPSGDAKNDTDEDPLSQK